MNNGLIGRRTVAGMGCWVCGKRRLLPWACRPCRRDRRRMRRDYLANAKPQDALTDMTRTDPPRSPR